MNNCGIGMHYTTLKQEAEGKYREESNTNAENQITPQKLYEIKLHTREKD